MNRRRLLSILVAGNLFLVALYLLFTNQGGLNLPGETTFIGNHNRIQITAPNTWAYLPELHQSAELEIGDKTNEEFLLGVSDVRADNKFRDIYEYSEFTRGALLDILSQAFQFGPAKLEINGRKAVQYELLGTSASGNHLVYIHTVIEGTDHYHQVVAWTTQFRYKQDKQRLKNIIMNFSERHEP